MSSDARLLSEINWYQKLYYFEVTYYGCCQWTERVQLFCNYLPVTMCCTQLS